MTRAERRRAKAVWIRRVRNMAKEAAGLWNVEVIRPNRLPSQPREVALNVLRFLAELRNGNEPLCLLSERAFGWPGPVPAAFICIRPHRDDASVASLCGLCPDCARISDDEMRDRALAEARRSFMPDARRLDPAHLHPTAGRA